MFADPEYPSIRFGSLASSIR